MAENLNVSGVHNNGKAELSVGLRDSRFVIKRNTDGNITIVNPITGKKETLDVISSPSTEGEVSNIPCVSIHDDLGSVIPEVDELYLIKYHDMPYGNDPTLISDKVFYRMRIGDGVTPLSKLHNINNVESGTGEGSIILVDPTYDNGKDDEESANNEASGRYGVSLGRYIYNAANAAVALNSSNTITTEGENSFVANENNIANAKNNFIGGMNNNSDGELAAILGSFIENLGLHSVLFGNNNFVGKNGINIRMLGNWLKSNSPNEKGQIILGTYNAEDNDALIILGSGTSENDRKNSIVVKRDGTIVIEGNTVINNNPFDIEKILEMSKFMTDMENATKDSAIPLCVYVDIFGNYSFAPMPGSLKETLYTFKLASGGGHSDVTSANAADYTEYPASGTSDRQWAYLGTTENISNSKGQFSTFNATNSVFLMGGFDIWTAFKINVTDPGSYSIMLDYLEHSRGISFETYLIPFTEEMKIEFSPDNINTYGTLMPYSGNAVYRTEAKLFSNLTSIAGAKPLCEAIDSVYKNQTETMIYDKKIGAVNFSAGEYLLLFRCLSNRSSGNLRLANIKLAKFESTQNEIKIGNTILTEDKVNKLLALIED